MTVIWDLHVSSRKLVHAFTTKSSVLCVATVLTDEILNTLTIKIHWVFKLIKRLQSLIWYAAFYNVLAVYYANLFCSYFQPIEISFSFHCILKYSQGSTYRLLFFTYRSLSGHQLLTFQKSSLCIISDPWINFVNIYHIKCNNKVFFNRNIKAHFNQYWKRRGGCTSVHLASVNSLKQSN